jgi:serine protein kinase
MISAYSEPGKTYDRMYDEINSFVSYVKDAAEKVLPKRWPMCSWASRETAKPSLSNSYVTDTVIFCPTRTEIHLPIQRHGSVLGSYGRITTVESQTYEDPMPS